MKIVGNCPDCGKDNLEAVLYDMNTSLMILCSRERKVIGGALMKELEFQPYSEPVESHA